MVSSNFWPLYRLSFYLLLLITSLVSSNFCPLYRLSFYLLLLITSFGIFKLLAIVSSVLLFTTSDYLFGIFKLLAIVSCVLLFTTSDYLLWYLQTFGHCIVCPSIYYFWLPPLVSSNLHKPHSDCPAFLFRQDPVFSQISISYKKCRQCKHVMLSELRRTITYGIGWLLHDWNNLILLRQNQH